MSSSMMMSLENIPIGGNSFNHEALSSMHIQSEGVEIYYVTKSH